MSARILIVDDNPTNLSLMEYLLRAFGHRVFTAANGERGVQLAKQEGPDLILMDLHMPEVGGVEALRRLRGDPAMREMRIVAVTASASVGERGRILSEGFDGYIAKPITPETFVSQVEHFLPPADRPTTTP